MMVGNNLTDLQLQQLVDRTIIKADLVKIIVTLRTTMEKYHILNSRIWLKTLTLVENLKSIKFDSLLCCSIDMYSSIYFTLKTDLSRPINSLTMIKFNIDDHEKLSFLRIN